MPNRLVNEKSPYLLQHADNPVDWYPYGKDALDRARREDKPLLISIGYSACHWCHVMAHESFEDNDVAAVMNRHFVNIKVDREERPDVDAVYMEAIQGMTGHGGWPLNVFATPDGKPFFGGTYFPPVSRHGLPAWKDVVAGVASAYAERRDEVLQSAQGITDYIERAQNIVATRADIDGEILQGAASTILAQVDWREGGLGPAPKFPQPLALDLMLRLWKRLGNDDLLAAVRLTLDRMASGGIYDHLGGGFHRYSVDASWIVPHFEKMLYDNALLARVYLYAYQATGEPAYRRVVEDMLDYLLRDVRDSEGGFYSAEDADSEGVEGKFYVWSPEELEHVLDSDDRRIAELRFGVTGHGNFEGKTILTVAAPTDEIGRQLGKSAGEIENRLAGIRQRLLAAREERTRPGKDTKILAGWNALAIRALAEAGSVLRRPDWLEVAERAMEFLLTRMRPAGRLVRSYRQGPADIPAFLEDYAFTVEALLSLYEATFRLDYVREAEAMAAEMIERFSDARGGGLYDSPLSAGDLVVRPRSYFDNPIPSGNSSATFAMLRLHALTGKEDYLDRAMDVVRVLSDVLRQAPLGFAYLLSALDFYLAPPTQIAIVGEPGSAEVEAMLNEVKTRFLPEAVLAAGTEGCPGLLQGRGQTDGHATAYVCRNFACQLPVISAAALGGQLDAVSN